MRTILFAAVSCAALAISIAGCASDVSTPENLRAEGASSNRASGQATAFETVKSAVEFENDPHMGTRKATGPEIRYLDPERNKWQDGHSIYKILAFDVGRSGADTVDFSDVQIRVRQATYGDWPAYSAAYSEGQAYNLTRIDTDASCLSTGPCQKTEIVGIDLTMDEFRALSERQILTFKIVGKRNSMLVEIPHSYLDGFLAAVDASTETGATEN